MKYNDHVTAWMVLYCKCDFFFTVIQKKWLTYFDMEEKKAIKKMAF